MNAKKIFFFLVASFLGLLIGQNVKAESSHDPLVKVFNGQTYREDAAFKAYHPGFRGGVFVAAGDLDGNGEDEVITGTGYGGPPEVRVYNGAGRFLGKSFLAFHSNFRGGVRVAAGDTDGDKKDEIIVAQNSEGEPWVKVYDCDTACKVKSEFLAFGKNFKGGVTIAAGDVDGNGKAEILVGAGEGGAPQVRLLDEFGKYLGFGPFVFDRNFKGGVNVAMGDINADGKAEAIVTQKNLGQAFIKIYNTQKNVILKEFLAFPANHRGGASLAAGDFDNDKRDEIIVGIGDAGGPQVRVFIGDGKLKNPGFFAYGKDFKGGVNAAYGTFDKTAKIVTGPGKSLVEGRTDLYKYIDINLSASKLKAYKGGRKVVESLISAGRPGMPTPAGSFQVRRKEANHWSGTYGLWMPYSLNFTSSYYIHKLPVWPSGYVEGEAHLGINVSHGCVRVSNQAAPILYEFAEIGTPISIHY